MPSVRLRSSKGSHSTQCSASFGHVSQSRSRSSYSLCANAWKPNLKADVYSSQMKTLGILSALVRNPANRICGIMKIGAAVKAFVIFENIHPISSPMLTPQIAINIFVITNIGNFPSPSFSPREK